MSRALRRLSPQRTSAWTVGRWLLGRKIEPEALLGPSAINRVNQWMRCTSVHFGTLVRMHVLQLHETLGMTAKFVGNARAHRQRDTSK